MTTILKFKLVRKMIKIMIKIIMMKMKMMMLWRFRFKFYIGKQVVIVNIYKVKEDLKLEISTINFYRVIIKNKNRHQIPKKNSKYTTFQIQVLII